ncbi:hypothetical protein GSQ51_18240 [Clostridioides difficile]|nr:hypothetical protein [Clostridioides difficile]NJK16029.1 hypothetical protein [Clostridioides difficile]
MHKTTKEVAVIAEKMGYKKTGRFCHGQAVFFNKRSKSYISADVDSHAGGFWKKASSIKNLGSKLLRDGTYNEDLTIKRGD